MNTKKDNKIDPKKPDDTKKPKSDLEKKLEKTEKDLAEITELAKRTMADLQNFKRRQEEERILILTMANAELIKELIPAINALTHAKNLIPKDAKDYKEGLEMAINQITKILKDAGLKEIETIGKPFNPDLHEALVQDKGEKNIIIEEIDKGYMIGNRVIRHAKVKIGNGQ
jgi:molecular chaperone GrpE